MPKAPEQKSKARRTAERLEARDAVRAYVTSDNWTIKGGEATITLKDHSEAEALQQELGSLVGAVPRRMGGTIILRENHLKTARDTISRNERFQG